MNDYSWPGNVRELINRVRRAIVMTEGRLLSPEDLDLEFFGGVEMTTLDHMRGMAERSAIEAALLHHDNRIGRAAAELRISRVTLYRLMVAHGMRDPAGTPPYDDDGDYAAKELSREDSA